MTRRIALVAVLAAACECGDERLSPAPPGQLTTCLTAKCPAGPISADPCASFDRPMACVNAEVARDKLGADPGTCAALCWSACWANGTAPLADHSCESFGTATLAVPIRCGNGFAQPGEECDDGDTDETDECLPTCKAASCGDGRVQAGVEECDLGDGNDEDGACLPGCRRNVCGDGELLIGVEGCDDGPENGLHAACRPDCVPAACGDGVLRGGVEECDEGDANDDTGPCLAGCRRASCGDGKLFVLYEECDDGADNASDGACLADCRRARCGDGQVRQGGEECDLGVLNADSGPCLRSCRLATCGDGKVLAGVEECDDGTDNGDGAPCLGSCRRNVCGDGKVLAGVEQCDAGTDNADTRACRADCRLGFCGDGKVLAGVEECDDGAANADGARCRTGCRRNVPGDGFLLVGVEECDDGPASNDHGACLPDGTRNVCGDGHVLLGVEQCDDGPANGPNAACRADCTFASCGDGQRQGSEECDDGGANGPTAACLPGCRRNVCGDGKLLAGTEECDAGTDNAEDGACRTDCRLAACGDGRWRPEAEQCDHGAANGEPGDPCGEDCRCAPPFYDTQQDGTCRTLGPCVIHVAVDGRSDGSSWADASGDLQAAVDAAAARAAGRLDRRCEVRVAAGRFPVWRSAESDTLRLAAGVELIGGFAGGESSPEGRAFDLATGLPLARTVLDGAGKVVHVVTAAPGAVLDGVVVAGGRGEPHHDLRGYGAGVYANNAPGLRLRRIRFEDNRSRRGGALAVLGGSATVEHAHFEGNAAVWDGGALYARGAQALEVRAATFRANASADGHGGAAAVVDVRRTTLDGVRLLLNAARWEGGAWWQVGGDRLAIARSSFHRNNAAGPASAFLGGGLFARGCEEADVTAGACAQAAPLAALDVSDTDFVANFADREGGGVYVRALGSLSFDKVILDGNRVEPQNPVNAPEDDGGRGGALAGYDVGAALFAHTAVTHNRARYDGGGLYVERAASVDIVGGDLRANTSDRGGGGGARLLRVDGHVVVSATTFSANRAAMQGIGLAAEGFESLSVLDCKFERNQPPDDGGSYLPGGGLFAIGHDDLASALTIVNSQFFENSTPATGGAVAAARLGAVEIDGCEFQRNGRWKDAWGNDRNIQMGGALDLSYVGSIRLANTHLVDNGPSYLGAAIYSADFDDLVLEGCTVEGHRVMSSGALAACTRRPATLPYRIYGAGNCDSPAWFSKGFGYGVPARDYAGRVAIRRTRFRDDVMHQNGWGIGAVHLYRMDSVTIEDSQFVDNATGSGPAPIVLEFVDALAVRRSHLARNGHPDWGWGCGIHHKVGGSAVVEDTVVEDGAHGSALLFEHVDDVTLRRSTVRNIDAWNWYAGALHVLMADRVDISDSTFENCSADDGGAVLVERASTWEWQPPVGYAENVTVRNTRFAGNHAKYTAGGLNLRHAATVLLENTRFEDNVNEQSGGPAGGAEIVLASDVVVRGGAFLRNTSQNAGGGLSISSGRTVLLDGVHFEGNAQLQYGTGGGAQIAAENNRREDVFERVVARNCRFVDNSSGAVGGGLSIKRARVVEVLDTLFRGNRAAQMPGASGCGGGLNINESDDILVQRCAFLDNRAATDDGYAWNGGGLYVDYGTSVRVHDSLFANNWVRTGGNPGAGRGGGMAVKYWNGLPNGGGWQHVEVNGCTFVGNQAPAGAAIDVSFDRWGDRTDQATLGAPGWIQVDIKNSILWGNVGATVVAHQDERNGFQQVSPWAQIRNSISQLGADPNNHVVNADPRFLPYSPSDPYRQYRPGPGSPAIGAGNEWEATTTDLTGARRALPPDVGALVH